MSEVRELQGHPVIVVDAGTIKLAYTNYRGETAERTITPQRLWFGATEWHPEPQWLLTAFDHDKQSDRDFALSGFSSRRRAEAMHAAKRRLADLELMIHHQTDKAVLVSTDDNRDGAVWLAKSQVEFEKEPVSGRAQIITMPEQLAFEKGLI